MNVSSKIGATRKAFRCVSSFCACAWIVGCGNGAPSSESAGGSGAISAAGSTSNAAGSSGNGSTSNGGAGAASNPGGGAPAAAGSDSAGSGNPASGAGGGSTMPPDMPEAGRVRTVIPFDSDWLFYKGNAAGADQAGFADSAWRALSLPHD